jgi:hypothetical protein
MRDWYQPPVLLTVKPAVEVEEWGLSWSREEAEAIRASQEDLLSRFEMHEPRATTCYSRLKAAIAKPGSQGKLETDRDRKADKLIRDSMSNMMAIALALDKAPRFVSPDVLIPDIVECIRQMKTARTWLSKAREIHEDITKLQSQLPPRFVEGVMESVSPWIPQGNLSAAQSVAFLDPARSLKRAAGLPAAGSPSSSAHANKQGKGKGGKGKGNGQAKPKSDNQSDKNGSGKTGAASSSHTPKKSGSQ